MPGAARRRWRFRPGGDGAALAALDPAWERLESLPGAVVLKSNPVRQVIALPAAEGRPAVVVKRYHVRGRADRLAHLVRPSRAKREWRALRALEAAGLPTPRPLGWFEARRGAWLDGAGLVMERLEGVLPLPGLLSSPEEGDPERASPGSAQAGAAGGRAPGTEETALRRLRATGALVARLHRAGIAHPDLHLGNFLGAPGDPDDVRLVDLHAVHHRRRVSAARRRRDLAKLVHSLGDEGEGASRARAVLAAYLEAVSSEERGAVSLGGIDAELPRIALRAREIERIRLASRDRRCWGTTSQFIAERRGRFRVHRRRAFAPESLAPLLDGIHGAARRPRASCGESRVELELPTPAGARVFVVECRERSALAGLLDLFRRGPLARAWGVTRRLEVRRLPHARAEALLAERRPVAVRSEILVTERVSGRTLAEETRARAGSPRELERFLRRAIDGIAPLLAELHRAGIRHRDLGPSNWLVVEGTGGGAGAEAGAFLPLALDRVRASGALRESERRRNLVDLALLPFGLGTTRLYARFLLEYLRRSGAEPRRGELRELLRSLAPDHSRRRIERIEALAARELASAAAGGLAAVAGRRAPAAHAGVSAAAGAERAG